MDDKELTDDPTGTQEPLEGGVTGLLLGQLQRRGSTAMPGGRQGTKANAAHLTALPACVTIITNSCWVAGPRLGQGLLIPNQSGCLPGPVKASVLNVWLQNMLLSCLLGVVP